MFDIPACTKWLVCKFQWKTFRWQSWEQRRKTFRHEIFSWKKIFFEKKYFVCFKGISQLKESFSKLKFFVKNFFISM